MMKEYKNNIIGIIIGFIILIVGGILYGPAEGSDTIREVFGIIFCVSGGSLFLLNFVQIIWSD